uniref:sodium channel and clathrin linker 1 isoform X5 n=1 Tax=Jaculus jaculus TaxID=51337 RepID=UPI001E1B49C8|nr:sodium channel and clathrin linker 1 isoform X5 [Jaculus jaculus]
MQKDIIKADRGDIRVNSFFDQSFLPPLITEYEKQLEKLNAQLKNYQKCMGEMKLHFENLIRENERLHSELKDTVEKQLEALPFETELGHDIYSDDETVKNFQQQLQLVNQEKTWTMELWQTASQELERMQKLYQEHMTEVQLHVFESQKQKDQLNNFHQLTKKLHVANENIEITNQHFLKIVTEQNVEIEQLREHLRQAKLDLRVAVTKVEELTRVTEDLHGQMLKKEEDIVSAQGKEEASDKRLQQLQSSIKQLERRLCAALDEVSLLRTQKTHLEKQTMELHAKYSVTEKEKYEAIARARDSMQLLEEANLKKNQSFTTVYPGFCPVESEDSCSKSTEAELPEVLLEEKQKEEDREKMKKTISQLLQDASIKARKEIYREGKQDEGDYRKFEEMHQRCLAAERSKDDLQLRLQSAENKIKQLEINSSEEILRSHEMIQKLQTVLESERENCGFVSEQRLKLQQENEHLQKETEDLRKIAVEAQKKAKLKISTMEQEFSIKEHGFEVQLREMEDSNRNSIIELRHLLATQQKTANRWKEETKKLTESAEVRISNLKSELNRQKLHTQELLSQLEMANEKVVENEKLILEHQEKANRLQRRLSQAEERAASASQQLSVITVQRRKATSMMNLENI